MPCREESCCPQDPFTYKADSADTDDPPAPTDCPEAVVTFSLPDGSTIIPPTYVGLVCNVPSAAIRYTTDGTDPTSLSTLYTVPILIDTQYANLKARAFITGCDPGAVATANYQVHNTGTWEFGYLCESGDYAGGFNEFAANGTANDYQFVLSVFLTEAIELVSIEIYQTTVTGFWDSGQCWGTKEYLQPFEDDPAFIFRTYPIVIRDKTNTSQWYTEYKDSLGAVAAGTYQYRLWGQPSTALNGYFLCRITLGDGTIIRKLINTTCVGAATVPDPPCTTPSAPGSASNCTPEVDLDFSVGAGVQWKLFRRDDGGAWGELSSGTAGGLGLVGYADGTVEKCHTYEYYVSKLCNDLWYDSGTTGPILVCSNAELRALPTTVSLIYTVPNPPGAPVDSAPVVLTNSGFESPPGLWDINTVGYFGSDGVVNCSVNPGLCADIHGWYVHLQSQGIGTDLFIGYKDGLGPTGSYTQTSGPFSAAVVS